jgi:Fic family protein
LWVLIVSFDTIKPMPTRPPFNITLNILNLTSEISHLLGKYEGLHLDQPQPKLRRQNRIKTIQASLAIEGNTLDLEQVSAIFDNKRVFGPEKDVLEVKNAIQLYESGNRFKPNSVRDLLKAHALLMNGLSKEVGKFRVGAVGILKGSKVSHIAPPAKRVPELMDDLFTFLKNENELSTLIKACVFHYELEFIHPFSDGNGRMGRFWQHLILSNYHPAFVYIPVESMIKERQSPYYRALEESDKRGDSTPFIEYSLKAIQDSLADLLAGMGPSLHTSESRLDLARGEFADKKFSRKEYLSFLKTISTATASRDLVFGVSKGVLERFGTKAVTKYRFKV